MGRKERVENEEFGSVMKLWLHDMNKEKYESGIIVKITIREEEVVDN